MWNFDTNFLLCPFCIQSFNRAEQSIYVPYDDTFSITFATALTGLLGKVTYEIKWWR